MSWKKEILKCLALVGLAMLVNNQLYGQTKFSVNTCGIIGLSNKQFSAFGDFGLRVERKINPAFGVFGDVSLKRMLNTTRGICLEIGINHYQKPNNFFEFSLGSHFFSSIEQQAVNDDKLITLTSSEVRPFLNYLTVYKHHQIFKIIDIKYGFEYGYQLQFKEELTEPIINDLKNPVVYLGVGMGVILYQLHERMPYED